MSRYSSRRTIPINKGRPAKFPGHGSFSMQLCASEYFNNQRAGRDQEEEEEEEKKERERECVYLLSSNYQFGRAAERQEGMQSSVTDTNESCEMIGRDLGRAGRPGIVSKGRHPAVRL